MVASSSLPGGLFAEGIPFRERAGSRPPRKHPSTELEDMMDMCTAGSLFSEMQLAQLRDVVRDAFREEMSAQVKLPAVPTTNSSKEKELVAMLKMEDNFDNTSGPDLSDASSNEQPQGAKCRTTPAHAHSMMGELSHVLEPSSSSLIPQGKVSIMSYVRSFVSAHGSRSRYFEGLMGTIILLNALFIGMELEAGLQGTDTEPFFWAESLFLSLFLIELLLRAIADGRENLKNWVMWFDATLVVGGVVNVWVFSGDKVPLISQLLTLRLLRLFKLVRTLRSIEFFQELWRLCNGLVNASRTMLSVMTLILLFLYVFACLGVGVIAHSETLEANDQARGIVEEHFSSLSRVILTLLQFSNADSIASIYYPLCREQPLLIVYFLALWLVVTVFLMNLVTAIVVETALSAAASDQDEALAEKRKIFKKIEPQIRQVFKDLDEDGSGKLTMHELSSRRDSLQLPRDIATFVQPEKLMDIFEFLDGDESGEIDEDEFIEGVCVLALSSVPIETTQILQLLRQTHDLLMQTAKRIA